MIKVYRVSVDIERKAQTPTIEVNTNDLNSVKLMITVTRGSNPLPLTGMTVRIAIKKPDNNIVFQECEIIDALGGLVEVILENQAYSIPGTHLAELMCYPNEDITAVTGSFTYKSIQGIMNNNALESKSEFTTITNMLKSVQDTIKDVRENGTGIDAQARADIQKNTAALAEMPKTVNNIAPDSDGNIQIEVPEVDTTNLRLKTEKISQLDVTEEFLQQMAGDTPINVVPADKSISPKKTDFMEPLTVNMIDHTKLTPGYIDGTTGAVVSSESFKVSDFVEVIEGQSYSTNGGGAGGGYYNANKELVQAIPWNATKPLIVPSGLGIRFIRFPFATSQLASARMFNGTTLLDYTPFVADFKLTKEVKIPAENIIGDIDIEVTPQSTSFLKPTKNIFDKLRIERGYSVSSSTGALNVQTDQNFAVVQFMEVKPSTTYQKSGNYHVAFYDANKVFISGIASGASARSWTTPSNARYVTITLYLTQDNLDTYMVYEGSSMPTTYVPPYELTYDTGKQMPLNVVEFVSYGDSLSQMNVWQDTVAKKLGLKSVVRGIGSTTITENGSIAWVDANGMYLDRPPATQPAGSTQILSSMSNDQRIGTIPTTAKVITLFGGTNDLFMNVPIGTTIDFNDVTKFKSAYAITIKKIQLRCPRARLFTITPPPNNKHNTPNTAGHTTKDYADTVKEVSRLFGIPCIDLYGEAGWNEYNMNIYLSDGVHPLVDTGGARMAEVIAKGMQGLV